jgi:hypothetical protein
MHSFTHSISIVRCAYDWHNNINLLSCSLAKYVQRLHLWVCHEHEPMVNDHSTCTVLALNYGLLFHRKFPGLS